MNYPLFSQMVWIWILIGIGTFFYLLRQNAPYGRHIQTGWGPTLDNRLGWFLMEFTVILVFLIAFLSAKTSVQPVVWVFSTCFLFHYLNRSIVFPLRIRTKGKRMPLIIVLSAIGFNLINGFFLGYYFARFAQYPVDWCYDIRFVCGILLFVLGLGINWYSDHILIHLRPPGTTDYQIPQAGLFRWISCPNLLGEMIEWFGFALMSWCLPGLAFAIWTVANLAPRAMAHHRWYQTHFPDYPKGRKALIPFLI